ncbi:hypothetical protein AS361_14860 [Myroides marinus]|uniref:hypothetical protein n=1 Tax=Myroides marinus TaxID=703342 RepID=UPI0007423800|nr:hypothetical protein [Myroides marinus]KUF45106.1 hypothetical protein AS361_14860 [Myroides marinus]
MLDKLKIDLISRFYPLPKREVVANISILNFSRDHFMMNEHIEWDIELIDILKDYIDWNALFKLKSLKLDIPFFEKFIDYIDFSTVGLCSVDFSGKVYLPFLDRYPWKSDNIPFFLNHNKELIPFVLAEYKDVINWQKFSLAIALPYITIVQYEEYIDWDALSQNNKLDDVDLVLLHYRTRLNVNNISRNLAYVELIRTNPQGSTWKWDSVLLNHGFSIETDAEFLYKNYRDKLKLADNEITKKKFINKCLLRADKLASIINLKSIGYISWSVFNKSNGVALPENLLEQYKDKIDFTNNGFLMKSSTTISFDFIRKNISLFDISNRNFARLNLDLRFVEEYEDVIYWVYLSFNEFLQWNEDFIIKYKDRLDFLKLSWNKSVYLGLGLDKRGLEYLKGMI